MENTKKEQGISYEEPTELTPNNVVYYSSTYKGLKILDETGTWKTYAIRMKARRFLRENCIVYSKEKKCYQCLPIKGYNKTTYDLKANKDKTFECSCQFHQQVVKKKNIPGLCCSHALALKLMLKMWNYNKQMDKKLYPENY